VPWENQFSQEAGVWFTGGQTRAEKGAIIFVFEGKLAAF